MYSVWGKKRDISSYIITQWLQVDASFIGRAVVENDTESIRREEKGGVQKGGRALVEDLYRETRPG